MAIQIPINGLMTNPPIWIYILLTRLSHEQKEVHNDTAPDSGGGVSAFETMVTEYREGQ